MLEPSISARLSMVDVILVSQSEARKQLLKQIGLTFHVVPSNFVENLTKGNNLEDAVNYTLMTATGKMKAFLNQHVNYQKPQLIIAADTVVYHDNRIIGKASSEEEAFTTLKTGRKHNVITAVIIAFRQNNTITTHSFTEKTEVDVSSLSNEMIRAYIRTREPINKAGSYAIQGYGASLIESISGDFYNVVGLPLNKLCKQITNLLN